VLIYFDQFAPVVRCGAIDASYVVSPIDERTQSERVIEGYVQTAWRNPVQALVRRPLTLSELTESGRVAIEWVTRSGPRT
jgi:hypothetical protein